MFPRTRVPAWLGPTALAAVALAVGIVPFEAARTATHDLYGAEGGDLADIELADALGVSIEQSYVVVSRLIASKRPSAR